MSDAPPPKVPRVKKRRKSVFSQEVTGLQRKITVEEFPGMGHLSTMGFDSAGNITILVNQESPKASKAVGLLYQLMSVTDGFNPQAAPGSPDKAATLLMLLAVTGLLDPAIGISPKDIQDAAAK